MKPGKTLQELAAELDRTANAKADYIVPTPRLTMLTQPVGEEPGDETPVSELHVPDVGEDGGASEFKVLDLTHQQIGLHLGIPKKFYDRLRGEHPGLLDTNVNTLFREHPAKRMVRTLDGRARAFLSDRYRRLDNYDLAQAVLPILGEYAESVDLRVESCELTDRKLYIKALMPRIEGEIRVGEIVQAGLMISNSEVGLGSVQVQPLLFKLACSNGMISNVGTKRYHVGRQAEESDAAYMLYRDETLEADDKAFWMKIQDTVRASCTDVAFNKIVEQARELAGIKVEGTKEAIERLDNKFSLAEGEKESILGHLIEGSDLSAWGLVNAVTRAAQDVESYDRSTEMERIGGQILELPKRDLETIAVG